MPDPQKINVALNASVASVTSDRSRVRVIAITSRGMDGGPLVRFVFDEVMSSAEAKDLLTDIRDQADHQLQKLWPESEEGRHRA